MFATECRYDIVYVWRHLVLKLSVHCLRYLVNSETLASLMQLCKHEAYDVQFNAVNALANLCHAVENHSTLGQNTVVSGLVTVCHHEDEGVLAGATRALSNLVPSKEIQEQIAEAGMASDLILRLLHFCLACQNHRARSVPVTCQP